MMGNFRIFAVSNCWQNGWPTDAPECPRSSSDAAGDRGNSHETPANVSGTAGTVQHRPRITTHTHNTSTERKYVIKNVLKVQISKEKQGYFKGANEQTATYNAPRYICLSLFLYDI